MNEIARSDCLCTSRLSQAIVLLIAGYWMINGKMTIGIVQAYFQYLNMTAEPFTEASFMINTLQSALASAERTFEFLDDEEEVSDTETPVNIDRAEGKICFDHVSFGYSSDKILMKDISFTAQPGQKIAVVGATGAGKTTLINLLMRFYEINGGVITIDGTTVSLHKSFCGNQAPWHFSRERRSRFGRCRPLA